MANVFPRMVIRNSGLILQKKDYKLLVAYVASVSVIYLAYPLMFIAWLLMFSAYSLTALFSRLADGLELGFDLLTDFFHAGVDKVEVLYRKKYAEGSK